MWADEYPYKVWINILTFNGKYLDYKICDKQRDWRTWTMRWNKEILDNQDKIEVFSKRIEVVDNAEHNEAFNYGESLVREYRQVNGDYQY